MTVGLLVLLISFCALLLWNVPIALVLSAVTVLAAFSFGYESVLVTVASDMSNGVDSFALLAIPFFIFAGELMGAGGLARRLIDLAAACVGKLPGGLSVVNTVTCMLFGSICGSAPAAVSSIGGTLMPEMERKGYPRPFNVAVTISSATTGLLIPPSNVMIVYALVAANVSVGSLFLAGVIPGLLVGLCLIGVSIFLTSRGKITVEAVESTPALFKSFVNALASLSLVVVVLGGILGGVFTATEASAIAVLWAFVLGVLIYREIAFTELMPLILRAARTSAAVLLLVATSRAMSQLLIGEQIPQQVSELMLSVSENAIILLLMINLLLLVSGTFMDVSPAILIFTPILLPLTAAIGMDPTHFGIVLIANLCIGLCTPPVGACLFVGCSVGKAPIGSVARAMLPFYAAMIFALLLITYLSGLSLWLPSLFEN